MRLLWVPGAVLLLFAMACGGGSTPPAGQPPATPAGLVATPGDRQVSLTWSVSSDADNYPTGYRVYRAQAGTEFTLLASLTQNTFLDAGLVNGTTYRYTVAAVNWNGESAATAEVDGTPIQPPLAPTNLVATPGNRQVLLTWQGSGAATGYRVKRWTAGTRFTTIASPTTTQFTDTGLINGTIYRYVVSAVTGGLEGDATPEVTGDLHAQPPLFSVSPDWSDEFSQADGSSPDPSNWGFDLGPGVTGEIEYLTDRTVNAQIQGGNLVMTAQRETYVGADGLVYYYTSSRPQTQYRFSQQYGRIEARIQMPAGQGVWPAFWMLGVDYSWRGNVGWPQCGELDIMETVGSDMATNHGTLHGPGPVFNEPMGVSAVYPLPSGTFAEGFHTFGIDWVENLIQFYVDGQVYAVRSPADVGGQAQWVYNHPFYLILDFAVGGAWAGDPDPDLPFQKQMRVDYIRVYNQK